MMPRHHAPGRDQWAPPGACADCTATAVDGDLTHDDTCPIGRALDEMSADDRAFFADRPHAPHRVRPIRWVEVQQLRAADLIPAGADLSGWRVLVRQPAPGVRTRRFIPPKGRM